MFRRFAAVARHPIPVLVGVAVVVAAALLAIVDPGTGQSRLKVDASTERLVAEEDADRRFYDETRRLFGSDDTVIVALAPGDVYRPEVLERIRTISAGIRALEGVREVRSLTNATNLVGNAGGLEIVPFVREIPRSDEALAALRAAVEANPLYHGHLVSRDGSATAIAVHFQEMSDDAYLASGLDAEIGRIAREGAGEIPVWMTGGPHIAAESARVFLAEALQLPLLILAAFAAMLLISQRSLRGVLLPIATISIAVGWTLAIVAAVGHALNAVTVLVPPILTTLGLSYAVHVLAGFRAACRRGAETARDAVLETLDEVALPVVLTGLTTAIGFLTLALSPLSAVRSFGAIAALGVMLTVVASLTFTPAVLVLLPLPRRSTRTSAQGGHFDRFAEALGRFDMRYRHWIFAGAALLVVGSLAFATQLRVGSQQIKKFAPDAQVRVDFEAVNERLEGANPLFVVLRAANRDGFKEPAKLREIERLQAWLEKQPEVGGSTSLADYVKVIHRGFQENDPEAFRIPDSQRLISQLLFFAGSPELRQVVDGPYQTTSIRLRAKVVDSAEIAALTERLEARLEELPDDMNGRITGAAVVFNRGLDEIIRGQAQSVVAALGIIYLVLSTLFLSLRVGAIALLPNLVPISAYFGALGATGWLLSPGTSLIAPMVLGIAVDDTIHYFARFLHGARRHGDEERATIETLKALGRPVTATTAALCLGFLCMGTSEFVTNLELGVLAAFALLVAWAADVVLAPALCAGLRVVTVWDYLSIDLGRAPEKTMAAFRGLRSGQARLAALLGEMVDAPAGQRLFDGGEPGKGLYLVIDGQLRTWVDAEDRIDALATHGRGDSVGEVGLFHGSYATTCVVESDARLLRLDRAAIDQLAVRYPRVAARMLRNLGEVMAGRFAGHALRDALPEVLGRSEQATALDALGIDGLRDAIGDEVGDALELAGIGNGEIAALNLVPLVLVAWADETLDDTERATILERADASGVEAGSPAHQLLEQWLDEAPEPALFEAWRSTIHAILPRLSIEGRHRLRNALLARAREVAASSGGVLGVRSVSRSEESVLRELEAVFG